MATFAQLLQSQRERAGLTQAGLAGASGLSLGAIRDYEQGKREPSLRSAVMLAKALGVSVEAFAEANAVSEPEVAFVAAAAGRDHQRQ